MPGSVKHLVILHDRDPRQMDPPRFESNVRRVGGDASGDYESPPLPYAHGDLGLHKAVLDKLLDEANADNVPVPSGHLVMHVEHGQLVDWQPVKGT